MISETANRGSQIVWTTVVAIAVIITAVYHTYHPKPELHEGAMTPEEVRTGNKNIILKRSVSSETPSLIASPPKKSH